MKKPTPAQLAARARFAEMVRSGAFKKKAKKAAPKRKSNPASKFSVGDEVKFAPAVVKRAEGDARVKNMRGVIIEIMSAGKTALVDTRGTFVSEEGNSVRGVPTANLVHDIKRNPAKRKKTVSQKISQLMHEGYPQKQAVAVALSEQRAGKVKATPRKRNPITETLIYGLPAGETRDYMEDLLYDGGLKLTPEQIQKVLDAATAAGYHSFRVTGFDPTVGAAFVRTMGQTRQRKRNPATGRKASRTKLNPMAAPARSASESNYKYSVEAKRLIPGGSYFEPVAGFHTKAQAQDYAKAILASHPGVTLRIKTYS